MKNRLHPLIAFFAVLLTAALGSPLLPAQTLSVDATHAVNRINPFQSVGTTVDRIWSQGEKNEMQQPTLGKILSMGLKPVSYRQNTELQKQAWHWNPSGTWSDAAHQQGYFVGSPTPGVPIESSWGYNLPDQGSSLVDGNLSTYWKSNPYLAEYFTHQPDASLPQWVMVDLGKLEPIDAIRIAWANPYATHYAVQYWTAGEESPRSAPTRGAWKAFHSGIVANGHGGTVTLSLTPIPVEARYLRIRMTASSNTCDDHGSADRRNCLGYAISELYAGTLSSDGTLHDVIRHGPPAPRGKTGAAGTEASSIDPWHRTSDLTKNGDQTGFDYFFKSGITRGLPAMIPIAMIYSNPETAANQLAWLEARHYPISYVEMGEEPDGQWTPPEDDAALYIQFADALHKVDPKLKLGGPVFEGHNQDIETWPDAEGRVSWLGRFIDYLKVHGHLQDLSFVSFEHYPLDCNPGWDKLYQEPELIQHVLDVYRADGVPANVPLVVSETNYSAQSGKGGVTIFAALWEANYVGALFDGGGKATYYFNGLGNPVGGHCGQGGGILGAFNMSPSYQVVGYLSQYFANQLIAEQWFDPVNQPQNVYHVTSNITDEAHHTVVTAYALERPDGQWSIMAINNDRTKPHAVQIVFERGHDRDSAAFWGQVSTHTFGAAQYQWHPNPTTPGGTADPDGPAISATIAAAGPKTWYVLPPASITVIRGDIRGPNSK